MASYVQTDRSIHVTTPLGKDVLPLVGFRGTEAVSRIFSYVLDMIAENKTEVPFDQLLGQRISVRLAMPTTRSVISTASAGA